MAQEHEVELTAEEIAQVERVEKDRDALAALVEDLGGVNRRCRQKAAHVIALVAAREPELLDEYVGELLNAVKTRETKARRKTSGNEAQTRWEVFDALVYLVPKHAKQIGTCYEEIENALFDEDCATLRLSAFRLLCTWGSTERRRSEKVWPIIDEAIQCFHGDLEYRDMLGCLQAFAAGKIDGHVAGELAGRLAFDAKNGKSAYLRALSSEIYEALCKRFKIENPQKRAKTAAKKDDDMDDEE